MHPFPFSLSCCSVSEPRPTKATVPHAPPGDAYCMWLLDFAASLHLQHISAAVLLHYELFGQLVFAAGNGLFFSSLLGPAACLLRSHFYKKEAATPEKIKHYSICPCSCCKNSRPLSYPKWDCVRISLTALLILSKTMTHYRKTEKLIVYSGLN